MSLISVIVPVYKVEPYLNKCIESIVNQTYKTLEIILVDDGSPDTCPAICDSWAEKDSRIKVIHKENGGLSDARNAGMVHATGEYIAFVDSDDYIDPEMYQSLYEAIVRTDSDVASCGAKRFWRDGRPTQELCSVNVDAVFECKAAMEALITSKGLVQTVWNKLYKGEVAKSVLFIKGQIHEDEFWSWQVIARSKRVVTLKESYYKYLQRDNSIMGGGFSEKSLAVVDAKVVRQNYIEENMPNLKDIGRMDFVYTCMHVGIQVLKSMPRKDAKRHVRYLKGKIKEYPIGKAFLQTLTLKNRIHLWLLRFMFVPICRFHGRK